MKPKKKKKISHKLAAIPSSLPSPSHLVANEPAARSSPIAHRQHRHVPLP